MVIKSDPTPTSNFLTLYILLLSTHINPTFFHDFSETFWRLRIFCTFAPLLSKWGAIAQLVEQRTENPCVPGSIPGGTTQKENSQTGSLFCFFDSISAQLIFIDLEQR